MFAANWDRTPWDEHKLELWMGMLRTQHYGGREALWAARFLIREHKYPSIQFHDFHQAVLEYRWRKRQHDKRAEEQRQAIEDGDLEPRRARLKALAPLLQLAAPRKMV